jgi:hypothetical protein
VKIRPPFVPPDRIVATTKTVWEVSVSDNWPVRLSGLPSNESDGMPLIPEAR